MKLISLLKRSPGLDVAAFQDAVYLRAQARVVPQGCSRFVQSHTLLQGYRKGELRVDAIEEYWFDDEQDAVLGLTALRHENAKSPSLIQQGPGGEFLASPHVAKEGVIPRGAVKNIEFVTRRAGMTSGEFFRYWKDVHGPLGATIPSILRYEQNHAIATPAGGSPLLDGLAITWFASTAHMRAGSDSQEYRDTREDEANFLEGHLPFVITREVIDTGQM